MRSDTGQRIDPAEGNPGIATGLDLFPVSVIAFGAPTQPVERLISLQSAVARGVHMLTAFRLLALRLPFPAWLRLRAHRQA